jgi:hypothetical protein
LFSLVLVGKALESAFGAHTRVIDKAKNIVSEKRSSLFTRAKDAKKVLKGLE